MATQRVRVCVVLNAAGSWNAAGWYFAGREPPGDESVRNAAWVGLDDEHDGGAERIYWLEATLYTPEEEVVGAEVSNG